MRLSNLFAGAFIASALFTACTSDEIAIPKSELYAREFVKKFGVIDPTRDLSAATHTGINVVTSKPTDVKVYADIDGKRYIFAEGRKISGKTTLTFDLPKGVNEVIVDLNGREIKTALGGTVNDKAGKNGRAIWEKENEVVKISRTDYRGLTDVGVLAFKNHLPEDQNNLGVVTQNFSFIANGDFTIYPTYWQTNGTNTLGIYYIDENTNEMVLIPFYTNKILPVDGTKGNLLYTKSDPYAEPIIPAKNNIPLKDSNNPMDAESYYNAFKSDKDPAFSPELFNNNGLTSFLDFTAEDWATFKRRFMLKLWNKQQNTYLGGFGISSYFDISYFENVYWASDFDRNGALAFVSGFECEAKDATHVNITSISLGALDRWVYPGDSKDSHPGSGVTGWLSRGIKIHIAPGTKFGMYIRAWHNSVDDEAEKPSIDNVEIVRLPLDENGLPEPDQYRRFYSEAKYNPTIGSPEKNLSNVFGATYMYNAPSGTYRVLGFEDWGQQEHDLNDMMFFITSEDPMNIPDVKDEDKKPEPYEWLIAAEDLGGTYDWDFNDAVFAVTATHITDGEDNNKKTTEITVEPLASGGTLPIYVMFNGEIIEVKNNPDAEVGEGIAHYQIGGELHTWLNGYYRNPINVTDDKQTNTGAPITFVVNGEWSIAQHIDNPTWAEAIEYKGMGGFYVLVNRGKSLLNAPAGKVTKFDESILDDEDNIHVVKPPKEFSKQDEVVVSPEMLCMKNTWNWPKEQCGIHEVYGQFQPWLTGVTESWYGENDPVISTQVVRRK